MINLQHLLDKYQVKANLNMLLDIWNESHRHHHNLSHLTDLIESINENYFDDKINDQEKELLLLTALFHKIVCDPISESNEEKSAEFFSKLCLDKNNTDVLAIKEAILGDSNSRIGELFNKLGQNIFEKDFASLVNWENSLYQERMSDPNYKSKRLSYLREQVEKYPLNSYNILKLIEKVEQY